MVLLFKCCKCKDFIFLLCSFEQTPIGASWSKSSKVTHHNYISDLGNGMNVQMYVIRTTSSLTLKLLLTKLLNFSNFFGTLEDI